MTTAIPGPSACPPPGPITDLLVRYSYADGEVDAQTLGSWDDYDCEPTITHLRTTETQPGECVTVAAPTTNPGYDMNAQHPAPLKDALAAFGPGC